MTTTTTTAYTTRTLPIGTPLLFAGHTFPRPDKMQPIRNTVGFVKPTGGLWTCPTGGYTWLDWCLDEEFGDPEQMVEHTLTVASPTTVAVIDSYDDLARIIAVHGITNPHSIRPLPEQLIDFESLSREVDGVWLTAEGQRETRWTTPGLYGWDLETVLLFRWAF